MRLELVIEAQGRAETIRALWAALEALSDVDASQLGRVPPLLSSGVRYRSERRSDGRWSEEWRDAATTYRERHGDCEDLAAWLAAELRVSGRDAIPLPFFAAPRLVHCVVWTPAGVIDPSAILGMPPLPGADFRLSISESLRWIAG